MSGLSLSRGMLGNFKIGKILRNFIALLLSSIIIVIVLEDITFIKVLCLFTYLQHFKTYISTT